MIIGNKIVSDEFRKLVLELYPQLAEPENQKFLNLSEYLLLGGKIDKDTGYLILPVDVLAACEGAKLEHHRYNGKRFIDEFSQKVVNIKYINHKYVEGKARLVEDVEWCPQLKLAAAQEFANYSDNKVYFVNGNGFTKARQKAIRDKEEKLALKLLERAEVVQAKKLGEYLNKLPPNRFEKTLKYLPEAYKVAWNIPNTRTRDAQLKLLRSIEAQYKPYYKPVENSVRLFSLSDSILFLKSDIRHILLRDYREYDLKYAHAAIAAADWKLPLLTEFLDNKGSWWSYLITSIGCNPKPEIKKIIKDNYYALLYGSTESKVSKRISEALGSDKGKLFLAIPEIREILEARKTQLIKIRSNGNSAVTCFGNKINNPTNPRSILSQLSQARELQILWDAIELAISEETPIDIILYQFDGFTVAYKNNYLTDRWEKKLIDTVKQTANQLGILTELVRTK